MRKDTSATLWTVWIQHEESSIVVESLEWYTYPGAWTAMLAMTCGKKPFSFGILYKGA